jgi:hypothetical protein
MCMTFCKFDKVHNDLSVKLTIVELFKDVTLIALIVAFNDRKLVQREMGNFYLV